MYLNKGRIKLFISIIVAVFIVVAAGGGFYLHDKRLHNEDLREISGNIYNSIKMELTHSEILLTSFHGLFLSSEDVTREEFERFYQSSHERFPGLQAIEWVPKVFNEQRDEFEKKAGVYFKDYQFTERSSSGELVTASIQEEYYPIYYIEPYKGNKAALGYNLASETVRRSALEKNIQEGGFVTSHRVNLVQGKEGTFGILVLKSFILDGELKGFLLAVYCIDDLFNQALDRFKQDQLGILAIDNGAPKGEEFLYSSSGTNNLNQIKSGKYFEYPLNLGGTNWTLYTYPIASFTLSFNSTLLIAIIAISLAMLVFYMNRLEGLVKSRTREMKLEKDKAESANQAKTQFLSNISHEIRTPLTVVLGNTDRLIHKSERNTAFFELLMTIKKSGHHLVGLLDDMLSLSKIELDEVKIEKKEFAIASLLSTIEEMVFEEAHEKALKVCVNAVFPLPKKIIGDEKRVTQVIFNLCSNAIKFTDHGFVKVLLGYNEKEEELCLKVSDSGIGVSEEQQSKIFNPFVRGDNLEAGKHKGTGLGLSISKKLCHLMGGDVKLTSKKGLGSTFVASFHLRLPKDVQFYQGHEEIERLRAPRKRTGKLNVRGKILLAEDSRITQEITLWMLKKNGLRSDVVDNGQQAVDYAIKNKPDLILMDIQMPVMSGLEAVKKLRKLGYKLPILAITANVLEEDVKKYLASGFDDYIKKPISEDELTNKLMKYLPPKKVIEENNQKQLTSIFKVYISRLPDQVQSLRRLSQEGKWKDIERVVHTIRGTGSYFEEVEEARKGGIQLILTKAGSIETLIRANSDTEQINQELTDLYQLISKLIVK